MKRKLYLEGEIGERYGREITVDVDSFQEAFKLLEANYPDLRHYLIQCHEKGVGFALDVEGRSIEEEADLILPAEEGDMTIVAVPAGSKSGAAKILAAIAIIAIVVVSGGFAGLGLFGTGGAAATATTAATVGTLNALGTFAIGLAINLALQGIQQLMAPDPATDSASPQAYLFNGSEQNIVQGDPVPILYGELRVPGRPISFSIVSAPALVNSRGRINGGQGTLHDGSSGGSGSSGGGNMADDVYVVAQ